MKSKDQAILKIFYVKKSGNVIVWETFGVETQETDCQILEITESICCF